MTPAMRGCISDDQSRPSKTVSTGPRKYRSRCCGGWPPGVSKRTRMATPSSSTRLAMLPMLISPDRPLRPRASSAGMPHSGAMRGKSRKSASMIGAPSSAMRAAMRIDCASGGRPTGRCAFTRAVSRPSRAISIIAAVTSDCDTKKLLSRVKKPRKKITIASRRARSSSVLSDSRTMMSVTPASRPMMVRNVRSVSPTPSASSAPVSQRLGSGRPCQVSQPRQASTPAARAVVQPGRVGSCAEITQAMTASRKSVSRVSRGRLARVWRRLMGAPRPVPWGVCYGIHSYPRLFRRRWSQISHAVRGRS